MPLLSSLDSQVRAYADDTIAAGDVVWVTSQQGSRKVVSKASARSASAGATAALLVAATDAQVGEIITVASNLTIAIYDVVTGELVALPEIAGGVLGDPVYLSDTTGKVSLVPGSVERPVGHVVNAFSWEFNGSVFRQTPNEVELADLEYEGTRVADAVSYPELLISSGRIEKWLEKIHRQLAVITGEEDPL